MVVDLLINLAKQGLGFSLAVVLGWIAYEKDREVDRLNLRILRLVSMQRQIDETRRSNAS